MRADAAGRSVRQLGKVTCLRRAPLRFVGCFEAASRTGCAKTATLTHPEGAAQVLERARACLGGFTDLAVCDRRADADVHEEALYEKRDLGIANDSHCTQMRIIVNNVFPFQGQEIFGLTSVATGLHMRLQIVGQADTADETLLRFEPVDGFFAVFQQLFQ